VKRTEPDLVFESVEFAHALVGRSFHISIIEVSNNADGDVVSAKIDTYAWDWTSFPTLVHSRPLPLHG
jgi:hypothetical protein